MTVNQLFHLLLVLVAGFCANGQQLDLNTAIRRSISIENIGIENGLSQGMINDVVEGPNGYLWVATKDGLNRYDGNSFKIFRHDAQDENSISDNFIYSLLIDSRGRLWIGTQSAGVNLYDPSTERFIRFGKDKLSSAYVGELMEDPKGNILVETLNEEGFRLLMVSEHAELFPPAQQVGVNTIREVYPSFDKMHKGKHHTKFIRFDMHGGLWYYNNDTVYYADPEVLKTNADPQVMAGLISNENGPRRTSTFLESKTGQFFITNWKDQILEFDYAEKRFKLAMHFPAGHGLLEQQFIDNQNRFWTLDANGDILRIDLEDLSTEILTPNWRSFITNMRDLHTGISLEDGNGNLWLGTGGTGLLKISGKTDRFKAIPSSRLTIVGSIRTFRTEKKGGIGWYDQRNAEEMVEILENPQGTLDQSEGFVFTDSNSHLTKDSKENVWLGSFDMKFRSVCKLSPKMRTIDKVVSVKDESSHWFGNPIFLDHQENVWFSEKYSENGVNLYRYNPELDSLTTYQFPIEKGKFKYRFVSDWALEEGGGIWLGTMRGVFFFDPRDGSWQHFRSDPSDVSTLSSDLVLSVKQDYLFGDSILWVGTEGGGLNRLNTVNGQVQRFDVSTGLPNNVVYGVQPDKRGNLWLSTNFGLCHFNTKTFATQNFTSKDGLPHNEFNRYEYSIDTTGNFYFGSMGGVVCFDPEDFYSEGKTYDVVISSLMLFNKPVEFGDPDSGFDLPNPIEHCKELTFKPDADMISFGFSLLDLTSPDKNKFRYQLEGLSEEWIEVNGRNLATFTDLSPGSYTLRVVGCGSDNLWSEHPTVLQIHVLAPWYATWWFRGLMITAFLGWTYLFYRYRLQQLLRVERMRNRIAQDLHDEIGSTLSSVSLFSSVLKNRLKDPDEKSIALLDKINSSTSEMMESMNDMVWSIKPDNDHFELVINRMRAFAVNLCESKGVTLHFKSDNGADSLKLDMELRKNIYLIFKEAVNNSFKYANASELQVAIEVTDSVLLILIKDNGVGFDQQKSVNDPLTLGGNGLTGMKKRASEIGAEFAIESVNGTSIKLKVWI